ncbi:DNA primase [Ferruginibacter yonginensis]|uniref:DNA primase n=1 Tax=Ferruginibacter yonginensis TaxID=1310416 RepID=A0ABV8QRN0_9BACT
MISKETIQQIQNRIDIVEIVGSFVKLKRRGANYLGLCPFHNEKSPSFTVSGAKEIYKCFGCGKSGNTISFLMDLEKYSYVEALRWLANKYGIEIEETIASPEVKLQQQTSESLYVINNFAQKFFTTALFETDEGTDIALSYLKERGFREDIIKKFQLGYNPEAGDAFAKAATSAQYNQELLQKSGLVVLREERLRDNYRGRIIFPIHNQSGKVLGFGARLIKKNDKAPKYINTPENEIYVKSKLLYGSYFARMAIDKADECLLVEGYTDVVSLHQAGIENVVASGGTSLTPDQLRLIKKYTNNLTIIYDGDGAGVKAAMRGLDLALEEGLNVRLVLIPDNEDPDSYVNKIGAAAFNEFIANNKKDFVIFQLGQSLVEAGNDSVKKAAIVNRMAETISKITKTEHFTKRQDYVKQVAALLKIEEAGLNDLVNKFIREKVQKDDNKTNAFEQQPPTTSLDDDAAALEQLQQAESLFNKDDLQEKAIVRSLIEFGLKPWDEQQTVAEHIFKEMDDNELEHLMENQQLVNIIHLYRQKYVAGESPTEKDFLYHQDNNISLLVISVMESNTEISANWAKHYEGKIFTREDLFREEVTSTLAYFKLRKIKKLIDENQRELELATNEADQFLYLKTHIALKQEEQLITQTLGTVIFK